MTKIIKFIRHAESITNARGSWLNTATNPLTEKGHKQAKAVSLVLRKEPDLIVTSPYVRTTQTAQPTLERYPDVRHTTWDVQEYTQICHETRGQLTFDEKMKLIDENWLLQDPDYKDGPCAESFNTMINRVDLTIDRIHNTPFECAFVFSHGFFLSALFYRLMEQDSFPVCMNKVRSYKMKYPIPNTAIIECRFHEDRKVDMLPMETEHLTEK